MVYSCLFLDLYWLIDTSYVTTFKWYVVGGTWVEERSCLLSPVLKEVGMKVGGRGTDLFYGEVSDVQDTDSIH